MKITQQQLLYIMPNARSRAGRFVGYINTYCQMYGINTPLRMAHFLAQIAHESGELRYTEEIADGRAYEGRKDLGNVHAGDGMRYKGRGLIQLTGYDNYKAYKEDTGVDVLTKPTRLKEDMHAVRSACWYWATRKLNNYADVDDITKITKRINGGYNHLEQRKAYLARAKQALGI